MHSHEHHRRSTDRRALAVALSLVAAFMAVEVVAGVLAGSLAVLADAGHMLADTGALALALFASWLAGRPPTPQRSFGFRRAEILAALANGVVLVVVAVWIFVEALRRLGDPPSVDGAWVLVVGAAGLGVNLAAAGVLRGAASESLNVRGALFHVFADLLGSLGVIAAGAVVLLTGWSAADPLVALLIGLLVLLSAWRLVGEAVSILLEETPRGTSAEEVARAILSVPGVVEVHDLHIWTITSGFPALAAHVLVEPGADCHALRRRVETVLRARFDLDHTTLQVDHVQPAGPASVQLRRGIRRPA